MKYTDLNTLRAVNWLQFSVCLIAILARVWAVLGVARRRLEVSEYFVLVYIPFMLFGAAVDTYVLSKVDHPPVTQSELIRYYKLAYTNGYMYYIGGFLIRASLLGLYFQLCRRISSKKLRVVLWTSTSYMLVTFVATMIINLAACIPMERNWSLTDYCTPLEKRWVFGILAFLLLSTDFLLLVLAIIIASQIEAARVQLVAILTMLTIGGTSVIAGILRTIQVNKTLDYGLSPAQRQQAVLATMFWSCLELMFALLAACMPSYRILWRSVFSVPTTRGSSYGRKSYGFSSTGHRSGLSSDTTALTDLSVERIHTLGHAK